MEQLIQLDIVLVHLVLLDLIVNIQVQFDKFFLCKHILFRLVATIMELLVFTADVLVIVVIMVFLVNTQIRFKIKFF